MKKALDRDLSRSGAVDRKIVAVSFLERDELVVLLVFCSVQRSFAALCDLVDDLVAVADESAIRRHLFQKRVSRARSFLCVNSFS